MSNARFAPDGQTIVYAARWEGEPTSVYLTQLGSTESRTLLETADLFAVSSSGDLAVKFPYRGPETLSRMPLTGGAPRALLEGIEWGNADWAPDGKALAIVRSVRERQRLEYPVGTVLYETTNPMIVPRLSPAGDKIAFFERDGGWSLAVVDTKDRKKRALSTGWDEVRGGMPAWAPGGKEVWFTASEPGQREALWAVSLEGRRRLVTRVPGIPELYDISKTGRVLVGHHFLLNSLMFHAPGAAADRNLSWLADSRATDLSPDGRTLIIAEVYDGGGPTGSIYLRKTDGSPAIRLGEGTYARLSPDGSAVLATLPPAGQEPAQLRLLPTGAGETRTLVSQGYANISGARWMPDGKSMVVSASAPGHRDRLYLLEVASTKMKPLSPEGVTISNFAGPISPDGRQVIAFTEGKMVLWPTAGGSPAPIPGLLPGEVVVQFSPDSRSVYAYRPFGNMNEVSLVELGSGKRRLEKDPPADPSADVPALRLTPDGESYVYGLYRPISTVYVIDGLR